MSTETESTASTLVSRGWCSAPATVFVAPMRVGTGLQNKLLEAMAMPCVTTSLANDALHATDGHHLLVADTAAGLAEHVNALLRDPDAARLLARGGHDFVTARYDGSASTARLAALLEAPIE
jgi:hypothetical protein